MLEILQVRSNVSLRNILTTYAADEGDSPITKLQTEIPNTYKVGHQSYVKLVRYNLICNRTCFGCSSVDGSAPHINVCECIYIYIGMSIYTIT